MIDWFRGWAINIVYAVIIATLVEMLLPDNTSKKYIKIVSGIFIVYTIIAPVISGFTNIDLQSSLDVNDVIETSSRSFENSNITVNATSSIKNIYEQNLKNDLINRLKEKGYVAEDVNIQISNDDSYNIEKVDIKICEKVQNEENQKQAYSIVETIKIISVKISNQDQQSDEIIDETDKNNIKEFVKSTYDISIDKINVF